MILSNQVRCHKCGDTPFSTHGHDYASCKCGAIAVDGGMNYLRRVGAIHACDDLSIVFPDDACRAVVFIANKTMEGELDASSLASCILDNLKEYNIHYTSDGVSDSVLRAAAEDGTQWALDNGRNGLGALAAVARYVRDAGGVWKVPEHV